MTDHEIGMRYLYQALSESKRLGNLRVHQSNGRISINKPGEKWQKVMYVRANGSKAMFQRTVPRYVGELRTIEMADPKVIDKIIDELFGVPVGAF